MLMACNHSGQVTLVYAPPLTPPQTPKNLVFKNKILWKENNTAINYVYPTEGSHDQMTSSSTVKVPE